MAKPPQKPFTKDGDEVPVKVTHLITLLELGGAQRNTLHTVLHLDAKRYERQLLSGPGGRLDAEAKELARAERFQLKFIPALARPIRPWRDARALFEIWKELRRCRPAILHTHSSKAGILGRWAGAFARVPIIIHTYHGFGFNKQQKPWTRALFIGLERLTARLTDRLVFVSHANKDEAASLGIGRPDQYVLIRSGIKQNRRHLTLEEKGGVRQSLGIPVQAPLATIIGPFKPQKNLTDFLKIAKRVHDLDSSSRFLMVGDGEERARLEKLRRELGLLECVVMAGWREDIEGLLLASDVFVLTSLWEGLPRSLVEAMGLGVSVVAYATDGVVDLVESGHNGFLFHPGQIEPMAQKIHGLLKNEALRQKVGQAAAETIGVEFDIDHMVRQQETLYEKLLMSS